VCFDSLYSICPKHFSFQEELSEILSQIYIGFHLKYPLLLSGFNERSDFSKDFRKNTQISNFMKIRPVGAEWFHADGQAHRQADTTKLTVIFLNSANAPKKSTVSKTCCVSFFRQYMKYGTSYEGTVYEIWVSQMGVAEDSVLLACYGVTLGTYFSTFRYIYCFTQKLKALQSFATPVTTQ
jgi:hypothetical protein